MIYHLNGKNNIMEYFKKVNAEITLNKVLSGYPTLLLNFRPVVFKFVLSRLQKTNTTCRPNFGIYTYNKIILA